MIDLPKLLFKNSLDWAVRPIGHIKDKIGWLKGEKDFWGNDKEKTETIINPASITGQAGPVTTKAYNSFEEMKAAQKTEEEQQPQESPVETPPVKDQTEGEGVFDTTPTDEAQNNTLQAFFDYLEKAQNRVEGREDTAYQRAVTDMRKAGINPNLLGAINPAESKGVYAQGITATGNLTATNMQDITKRIMQDIDQIFEREENKKDRIKDYILGILGDATKLGSSFLLG